MHGRPARVARSSWALAFVVAVAGPVVLGELATSSHPTNVWDDLAVDAGLVGFALLVVSVVLIARIPSVVSAFGIERTLRTHRLVALVAAASVLGHIVAVLLSDPRGLSILDLRNTTAAARAAAISTVALALLVLLAVRRRRRQPRYERWRLLHIVLGVTVLLGAWLHIWWLRHLAANALFAGWLVAMGLVVVAVAVRRWWWVPARSSRRRYVVSDVVAVADNAVTVGLHADDHAGIAFRPGQFAYLKIGASPFMFEEHPFSIASAATSPHRKEFTVKALGDFSGLLHGLRPGLSVFVDGPYGAMTTDGLASSQGFVFIAGGIGITPMLSMLRTLADRGDERHHRLFIGARRAGDLIMRDEIERIGERLHLTLVQVVQDPPEGWPGEQGRIDRRVLERWLPKRGLRHLDYFVCGPPAMVIAVGDQLRAMAVPGRRIHTERFEVI